MVVVWIENTYQHVAPAWELSAGVAMANIGSTRIFQISNVKIVGPGTATFDVDQYGKLNNLSCIE